MVVEEEVVVVVAVEEEEVEAEKGQEVRNRRGGEGRGVNRLPN